MIRFIDLRGMSTGYRFAFWDTCRDQFVTFSGNQAWDTRGDFENDFTQFPGGLERFRGLMPKWVGTPAEEQGADDAKDAVRYRWLKHAEATGHENGLHDVAFKILACSQPSDEWDVAIDAAMS